MKLAFARAGMWFFGTIIVCFFLIGGGFEKGEGTSTLLALLIAGFVVGGAVFFTTWYNCVNEERTLKMAERRVALKTQDERGAE